MARLTTQEVQEVTPKTCMTDKLKVLFLGKKWVQLSSINIDYSPCIINAEGEIVVTVYDERYFNGDDKVVLSHSFPVNEKTYFRMRPNLVTCGILKDHQWKVTYEVKGHNLEDGVVVGDIKIGSSYTVTHHSVRLAKSVLDPPKKKEETRLAKSVVDRPKKKEEN
ncbi:hypothetical protein CTI12_AA142940 [Artemisia annua]|uniref:Uncharacterized protein n=1 Tax=Artemisia annua TaxID=35608 RepID=A0A2U1NLK8_ARTAN|nr:hypothetical protein CTI12_AA142930 [Artemisia annua]PWA74340.1 hypothetical protein CTI12_AA142940 [Artemisia annua]